MLSLSLSIPALAARGNRSGRALAPRFPGLAALYDPLDRGSLFRDVAMGSPVTADGQAVAAVRDQSGNGRHLLQPGSAARPAYRTDGALHWLEGDGVDDMLSGPVPVTGYPFTLAVAFELDGAGSGIMGFHEAANAYKALLVNGYLRAMDRTATVTQQAGKTDSGLPTRCVAVAGYTSTSVRLVTSEYATEKVGYSQSFGAPSDLRLFSFRDSDRAACRVYAAAVISRTLTASEKDAVLRWLADRAGLSA